MVEMRTVMGCGNNMMLEPFDTGTGTGVIVPLRGILPTIALPAAPTSLFGREEDVARVLALVAADRVRLVTLTGPCGVGKTRLALHIAHDLAPDYSGGAQFVDLGGIQRPEQVLDAIVQACEIQADTTRPALATLADALRGRQLLLVLDNVEQVVAAAPDIAALLTALPDLTILATSRVALRIRAEYEYPLAPLPAPTAADITDVERLAVNPAVALFVDRANAVLPRFALSSDNAADVAAICSRLDGLPLAIELAAARISMLAPGALLRRLDRRLPMLTGGPRDLPARQRTLQDAIAWSYDLLRPEHRASFRRLAVFAGGCTLEAATAVCGWRMESGSPPGSGDSGEQALDAITALVDANIIRRPDGPSNDTRYLMLETIREYGLGCLAEAGEETDARQAHALFMLDLALEAEEELVGPAQSQWYRRLDTEHENFRAALRWSIRAGEANVAQQLAAALWRYWAVRGFLLEAREWLDQALTMPGAADVEAAVRAKALHRQANVAIDLGDYTTARRRCEESLAIWQTLDESAGIASALNGLGLVAGFEGDYVAARTFHTGALERRRALGDLLGLGNSLTNLSNTVHALGDITLAEELLQQALEVRQSMGDTGSVAYAYLNIADLARSKGDRDEAMALFEQSLSLFQQSGDRLGVAYALHILGIVYGDAGEEARAMRLQQEALALRRDMGDRRGQVECIEGIASLLLLGKSTADRQQAVQLLAAATVLREAIGAPRPPSDQASHRRLLQAVRAATTSDQFRAAWSQGTRWTLAETVDQAEAITAAYTPPATTEPAISGLSSREIEVLRLVAQGLTNRQIADQLFLSQRTVHAHIYTIFRKIDVSSRSAATRFALEHHLT
ncbi:MAG: tetratricopeptide repeat protein [Thermomicrobiales bacterium]